MLSDDVVAPSKDSVSLNNIVITRLPSCVKSIAELFNAYSQNFTVEDNIFLSELWLQEWYALIGKKYQTFFLKFESAEKTLGFVIVALSCERRRTFFKRRVMYLNECPTHQNNLVLEYNGIICPPQFKTVLWQALVKWLEHDAPKWDEITLNLLLEEDANAAKASFQSVNVFPDFSHAHICPYALLHDVFAADATFDTINLSASKRRQIRKSIALYKEKYGDVELVIASSAEQAKQFFGELEKLHTLYWQSRGEPGAFANRIWVEFQHNLIARTQSVATQVIKVSAGDHIIGYIYNLVAGNKVFNIQSGLTYQDDNRMRPGFTCHYLTMKKNAELEMTEYHYLAGGESYKQSLSAHQQKLYWATIRRRRFYLIEDTAVRAVRLLRALLSKIKLAR